MKPLKLAEGRYDIRYAQDLGRSKNRSKCVRIIQTEQTSESQAEDQETRNKKQETRNEENTKIQQYQYQYQTSSQAISRSARNPTTNIHSSNPSATETIRT